MGCRHSSLDDENSSLDQQKGKYKTKIDPRILQKYDIQGNILWSKGTADGVTLNPYPWIFGTITGDSWDLEMKIINYV